MKFLKFVCAREGGGVQRSESDPSHVVCWGSVEYCIVVALLWVTMFPSSRHCFSGIVASFDWINVGGAHFTYVSGVSWSSIERRVSWSSIERGASRSSIERGVSWTSIERGVSWSSIERGVS